MKRIERSGFRRFFAATSVGRWATKAITVVLCGQMAVFGRQPLRTTEVAEPAGVLQQAPVLLPPAPAEVELWFGRDAFGPGSPEMTLAFTPCFEVSARGKGGKVQLTWMPVPGAARYDVFRAADAEPVMFGKIGQTTSTMATFLDGTAGAERTWLYVVQAVVPQGECFSGVVSCHPSMQRVAANHAPVIYSPPVRQGTVGAAYRYDVNASDPEGDVLGYGLLQGAPGMRIDPASGVLDWVPAANGVFDVTVAALDPGGLLDQQSFQVRVGITNAAPAADAGPDQSGRVGQRVTMDGSRSSDPDGDSLTFAWSWVSRPAGSAAALDDPTRVGPSFVLDRPGDYVLRLVVNDGQVDSVADTVRVSTINSPPVANAGPDQSLPVGQTVTLDGSASSDADGDMLGFAWSWVSRPAGSAAALSDPAAVKPTFRVDRPGSYVVQLVVNDGSAAGAPDTVTVSTRNSAPVANAGPDQSAPVGQTVTMDGSGSGDADGDMLGFTWSFASRPTGSSAALSNPAAVKPAFTLDKPGSYVLQLVVHDGTVASAPDTVTVSTVNSPPVASAGPDQSARVGQSVTLDGSGSSDVDGNPLGYAWSFVSRPAGSAAALSDPAAVKPAFTLDMPGSYVVQLVVHDGTVASVPDSVTVSTENSPPVANAGPDQFTFVGRTVTLDGSGSSDADGNPLGFAWSFVSRPAGSAATLGNPAAVKPTFTADRPGSYVVQLVVHDGSVAGAPDTVTVSTENSPPVANAGPDQTTLVGRTVTLDGSGSGDVDGDVLGFAWSFVSRPAGSSAALSDPGAVKPAFTVDMPGTYVAQLVVHDGTVAGAPDTVTISTGNSPPVANAGPDQTTRVGRVVTLDGSGSGDIDGNPLGYAWSLVSRPAGSSATLSDPAAVKPVFTVDKPGSYVAQLVVHDGTVAGAPDSVTVSTENSPPVANAGPDQTVRVTETVTLDAGASSDVDGNPLTFFWSFVSVPADSGAVLADPAAVRPTFTVDRPGSYVVQLIANDGTADSAPDTVTVTTTNSPPVARAGADQAIHVGQLVTLDGSGSSDVDGDRLSFAWALISVPAGSTAVLSDPAAPKPTFTADRPGTYVAQLIVHDGTVASPPDVAVVESLNVPPIAFAGPDQTVPLGAAVALDGSASVDPDGDPLAYAWSLTTVPAGSAAVLGNPAAAKPTFTADRPGSYVAQLIVNDGYLDSTPDTVTITTANSRPVANAGPDQQVERGATVRLTGAASGDPDDDPLDLRWSLTTVPAGSAAALSDPAAISPTFVADVAGTYIAQLIVSDGLLDSAPDTVTVEAKVPLASVPDVVGLDQATAATALAEEGFVVGNVTSAHSETIPQGAVISQNPAGGAEAPLGTAVDLVISLGPQMIAVPNVVGLARAPAEAAIAGAGLTVGAVATAISPTVPAGHVIGQSPLAGTMVRPASAVQLLVSLGDGTPVLASIAVTPATVTLDAGRTQQFTATGTFNDGATRDLTNSVAWSNTPLAVANLTTGGLVTGLDPGTCTVTATMGAVSGAATLTVTGPALASIIVSPAAPTILVGQTQPFTAAGIMSDGTSRDLTGSVAWSSSAEGVAAVAPNGIATGTADGTATITATSGAVSGGTGLTVRASVADGTAPTVAITSPANNSTITSPVDVIGTANDPNFLKYLLETAPAGETNFTKLAEGTAPVVNGVLGKFDPTMLLNDIHTVRLTVFDRGGNSKSASVNYQVARDAKVGIFTLAFEDLNLPMSGIPIIITRTYDSRDKGRGDFGIGWRLGIQTFKLRANRVQGTGWQVNKSGGFFPTYTLAATDEHKVSITLPDGKVEEFDLRPTPTSQQLVPFEFLTASYVARAGTLGTLVPLDGIDLMIADAQPGPVELLNLSDASTYDPQRFRYTSIDGRVLVISKTAGVQSITEPNGNALAIGPGGITHSSGKSIAFTRDGQGRITRLTDPDGNFQQYAYDANGDLVTHTDAVGNVTRFLYNRSHGLLEIRDPQGIRAVRNEYDETGRLVRHIDSMGNAITYAHGTDTRQELVTDRLGHVTLFEYDGAGNVVARTDALGNRTAFTYDARGNQLTVTDPLGRAASKTYDAANNLLTDTDFDGNKTTWTYNARGQVLTVTDPEGRKTTNVYDAAGNLTQITGPEGGITRFTYDARGNRLTATDPLGGVATYAYDAAGSRVSETDPAGGLTSFVHNGQGRVLSTTKAGRTTQFVYDAAQRVTTTTDSLGNRNSMSYDVPGSGTKPASETSPAGRTSRFAFDVRGNQTQTTFPDGSTTGKTYDAEGRVLTVTDRDGATTSFEYDPLGRQTKITHPDGTTVLKTYDAAGRPLTVTDERGHVTSYAYGPNTQTVTDPLGHTTVHEFDGQRRRVKTTDARGNVTTFAYDSMGHLTRTTYPDGTSKTTTYDAAGRKVAETDQAGRVGQFAYDPLGRLVRVTDAAGAVTTYTHDAAGNLLTQTDANGHTTTMTYDDGGRLVSRSRPLGQQETFTYDVDGNQLTHTDFNGQTTLFSYDASNHLTGKTLPGGEVVAYAYSPGGLRTQAGGDTYTYDVRGRLTRETKATGEVLTYSYDAAGNRTSLATPQGTTTYAYDALNRLTAVTDATGTTSYTYDAVGNLATTGHSNGTTTAYAYDALNRLTRLTNSGPGGLISSYTYTLGPAGNRQQVAEAGPATTGRTVAYTYDAVYRLTQEVIDEPGTADDRAISYTYDPVGNRLQLTRPGTVTNYTYDANDQLTGETTNGVTTSYGYTPDGSLLSKSGGGATDTYTYDAQRRMVAASVQSGTNPGPVSYTYDADGMRTSKTAGGVTTRFLLDKNRDHAQVLAESDGLATVTYSYGHDLIAQTRPGTGTRFYQYDGQMSTRALTDATGAVTDRYTYDAFGVMLNSTGATPNLYLYAGEQIDPNIGFYYLRARYYDQAAGRFTSTDPFLGSLFDPGSLHRYLYANANPVNFGDPSGQVSTGFIIAVVVVVAIFLILLTIVAVMNAREQTIQPFDRAQRQVFSDALDLMGKVGHSVEQAMLSDLESQGRLGVGPHVTAGTMLAVPGKKIIVAANWVTNPFDGKPTPVNVMVPLASMLVHELAHYTGAAPADQAGSKIIDTTAYATEAAFLHDLINYFETGVGSGDPQSKSYVRDATGRLAEITGLTKGVVK